MLSHSRELDKLVLDVSRMREKMRNHLDKSTDEFIDIKQAIGGLVDIEFLAQYLVLANCHAHACLSQRCDNLSIFKQLASLDILTEEDQQLLANCYQKLRGLGHKATLQNEALLVSKKYGARTRTSDVSMAKIFILKLIFYYIKISIYVNKHFFGLSNRHSSSRYLGASLIKTKVR